MTPYEMADLAARSLEGKKGVDIKVLKTHDLTVLADYFIVCTATSTTHIKTLSDAVSKALEEAGEKTLRTEGYRSGGWILVDFGAVVVHVFTEEARSFYALERLWSDAEEISI